jgi:predicted RNase H-like nuclease (RuvC/YqgF family)
VVFGQALREQLSIKGEKKMTERRSVWSRIGGFLWGLVKLILALAVIVALAVGIYYIGLYAYYGILAPINSNTNVLNLLQRDLEEARQEFDQELQARDKQIAQLEKQLGQLAIEQEEVKTLEETVADQIQRLAALGDTLAMADAGLTELEARLADLAREMDALAMEVATPKAEMARLRIRTLLLQASSHALKARIWLMQNNAGLAKEELRLIEPTLESIEQMGGKEIQEVAEDLRTRLDATLEAIDENPFLASEELDILWHEINEALGF